MAVPRSRPPRLAARLCARMARFENDFIWAGDLAEEFLMKTRTVGIRRARLWFNAQVYRSLPAYVFYLIRWSFIMFKNYLLTALRNTRKHKVFAVINVIGLSVGLAGCLLIFLYVKSELSYDRFHVNAKDTYRVLMDQRWNKLEGRSLFSITPGALAPAVQADCPEIVRACRSISLNALLAVGEAAYNEGGFLFADPEFLDIFDFPLVSGDRKTALAEPFSVLITRDMSRKYFGDENPVGRTINLNKSRDLTVTGVLENIPANSHLQFDFLASFASLYSQWGRERVEEWKSNSFQTYVQLREGQEPASVAAKFTALLKTHKTQKADEDFILQPLTRIHLYSAAIHDSERGNIKHVNFLTAIAAILILIAVFNFINLSTARASTRAKEVGMRKVIGADRTGLVRQFLGESVGFAAVSFAAALGIVRIALPTFNALIRRNLTFGMLFDPGMILGALVLVLFVGFASGIHPAVYLASFQPTSIFRAGGGTGSPASARFRNALVFLQFAISIALIVCSLVVGRQLDFMRNRDLGFKAEEILNVRIQNPRLRQSPEALKTALESHPGIRGVLLTNSLPTTINSNSTFTNPPWAGKAAAPSFYVNWAWVDERFFEFYGIPLVQGRLFSRDRPADSEAYIINETAARVFGWEDPIGRTIRQTPVIGVVRDFHFRPLRNEIEPLAIALNKPGDIQYFSIKVAREGLGETMAFLGKTWKQFSPGYPLVYSFLDERLERLYVSERLLLRTFNLFAGLAVLLSSLGLFGLALFTAAQKTREIGIRKVLGASIPQILLLLSRDFLRWVLLGNLIAWPAAYAAMKNWLQGFAYRIPFPVLSFLAAGILALGVAVFTIGLQSLRAARANPVTCLRSE